MFKYYLLIIIFVEKILNYSMWSLALAWRRHDLICIVKMPNWLNGKEESTSTLTNVSTAKIIEEN